MQVNSTATKTRGTNYKLVEDKVLCQAWLSVSKDPIYGIYQSGDDFYLKVKAAFDAELTRLALLQRPVGDTSSPLPITERPVQSLSSRFQTISQAVSKFVACHERVANACRSGRSPVDMEHDAVTLYESLPKNGKFKFMQCWYILRDSEKWGAWRASNGKRTSRKRSGSGQAVSQIDRSAPADETVSTSTSDTQQVIEDDVSETREKGVSRAKMDRANLSLYARQVKAAERAAVNAEKRIAVAQEHLELSLFTTQPDPNDALAAEYLALKKQAIIKRLRQETSNEGTTSTVSSSSEGTNAWVSSQNAAIRGSPESDTDPDITSASSNTDTTIVGGVIDSRVV